MMLPVAVPLKHSVAGSILLRVKPAQIARLMGHHPMQTTVAKVAAIADDARGEATCSTRFSA